LGRDGEAVMSAFLEILSDVVAFVAGLALVCSALIGIYGCIVLGGFTKKERIYLYLLIMESLLGLVIMWGAAS